MLTLLKNIERFNKRYNKKRGSAMLMVLMTMAIIIVVGTSMLFVTLSSFSNSIAGTQQERAYNAALTVSDTLKGSDELNAIIETYLDQIKDNGSAEVEFYSDNEFDTQAVNYTVINGVKVYVTLSKSPNSKANKIDKILVDIKGVKGSQESKVSFEVDSVATTNSSSIDDTFGSSFVVSNNMGSEATDPYQIFKRIEGDVSLNCFETDENGDRVMKTRLFNPLVLEGVTGSIYANGDLIIGAVDNMIRVQGNIYCDGNLTIRGLELGGINLPALMKKYYNRKYIHYYTYSKKIVGSVELPFTEPEVQGRDKSSAIMGEAMYEKINGQYRPLQVYDKISHYTLMDLADENAETYTFWTRNWDNGGAAEQVTITLRVKDQNGIWQGIDAEFNQGGINNAQYLGASMYYDQACTQPIVQFPEGGNIYCSGDIIFDTVNRGNVFSYDAGFMNTGISDDKGDETTWGGSIGIDKIDDWLNGLKGDLINTKYDYYSLSYGGKIPVRTYIGGDVFCQGRMIIAPEINNSYVNYKKVEKLGISADFSRTDNYIGGKIFSSDKFVFKDSSAFLGQIKNKWQQLTGQKWGDAFDFGTVKLDLALNRYYTNDLVSGSSTLAEYGDNMATFIEAYKKAYENQKSSNSESIKRLKKMFEKLGEDGYSYVSGNDYYVDFGSGGKNIKDFNTPSFNSSSNLYIQNSPIRKGTGETALEKSEKYASDDKYLRVTNAGDKDKSGNPDTTRSVVGGISYTAALTVKYCKITVNNVYCDGAISVLASEIPGYVNEAAVNVNGKYFGSDFVKNELKKASIKDFLRSLNLSDDEILKEYFGVDGKNNAFRGETDFVFDVKDDSQNYYKEDWWDGLKHYKENITHNRKVVIIRAHYEMTETVVWTNSQTKDSFYFDSSDGPYWDWDKENICGKFIQKAGQGPSWTKSVNYSNGRLYADLVYCIEDNAQYSGNDYENKHNNYTNKLIKSDGKPVEYKDRASLNLSKEEEALVKYLYESRDSGIYKYALSLAQAAFIDYDNTFNYKQFLIDNKDNGIATSPSTPNTKDGDIVYKESITESCRRWHIHKVTHEWVKTVTRNTIARVSLKLIPFADITGGSESLINALSARDIFESGFLNKDYLITMFSNGVNDFDGIINNYVGAAIKGGSLAYFGKGNNVSYKFDAMKQGTRAFDGLYGMYLLKHDSRYADVENDAYVKAIFEEICSSAFATVIEANTDKEASIDNLEKMLKDLQDEDNIVEYNAFDTYGGLFNKSVSSYICSDDNKLRKKLIGYEKYKVNAEKYESWIKINTLNEGQAGNVVIGYITLGKTGSVEDSDGDLQLLDFYDKTGKSKARLRADSTFAVDPKYNDSFTANELSIKDFSAVAKRSEIQYTINKNTYFNFGDYTVDEIWFRAATNDITQRTRMNFLIDTSDSDIYMFFRGKDEKTARFEFTKCTFQVTGKNNVYFILLGDTSFSASAHSSEINNSLGSNDKSDERVGTHFTSGTYQKYGLSFKEHGNSLKLSKIADAIQVNAVEVGNRQNVGNMFIIGMGNNVVNFGRGGSVNALVYIPNGKYTNNSSTLLNIIPIASSANNEASIVAKDIYIGGNNRGKLIFTSYDVARMGSKNSNSAGLIMDGLINGETVSHTTKWVAGRYYYG